MANKKFPDLLAMRDEMFTDWIEDRWNSIAGDLIGCSEQTEFTGEELQSIVPDHLCRDDDPEIYKAWTSLSYDEQHRLLALAFPKDETFGI